MWILGSHNSWSYLPVEKWWMKFLRFTAKCQDFNIKTQYEKYNVRCFDLRISFNNNASLIVSHGIIRYKISAKDLLNDLSWLNNKKDCYVRVLNEVRNKSKYSSFEVELFTLFCSNLEVLYPNIKFWCGRNLYNWNIDYTFKYNPSCEENYSSVHSPKLIDDWYPRLYAYHNNKHILKKGTDKDILLIDFVNYE